MWSAYPLHDAAWRAFRGWTSFCGMGIREEERIRKTRLPPGNSSTLKITSF